MAITSHRLNGVDSIASDPELREAFDALIQEGRMDPTFRARLEESPELQRAVDEAFRLKAAGLARIAAALRPAPEGEVAASGGAETHAQRDTATVSRERRQQSGAVADLGVVQTLANTVRNLFALPERRRGPLIEAAVKQVEEEERRYATRQESVAALKRLGNE